MKINKKRPRMAHFLKKKKKKDFSSVDGSGKKKKFDSYCSVCDEPRTGKRVTRLWPESRKTELGLQKHFLKITSNCMMLLELWSFLNFFCQSCHILRFFVFYTWHNYKRLVGVLGTRTRDSWIEGADESNEVELWSLSCQIMIIFGENILAIEFQIQGS